MKTMKRVAVLLMCLLLLASVMSGCGNQPATGSTATPSATTDATPSATTDTTQATEKPASLTSLFDQAGDSSDLPDWTGTQLNLTYWYGHGTGDAKRDESSNDVFSPEIKRVFGISYDAANSFDNGGQDLQTKISLLASTNNWPDIGESVLTPELVANGKVYDLTDLLPVYAPHYYAMLQKSFPEQLKNGYNKTGRIYSVNHIYIDTQYMQTVYPDLDLNKYQYISGLPEVSFPIYVRDDILKLAYPNAKTEKEIEDLYMKNGTFTKEDVYDVPLTSIQDFKDFMYKIKDTIDKNNIKEGNKPVQTTWVSFGGDNWALYACFDPAIHGLNNYYYFGNFNYITQKMEVTFAQPQFKEDMKLFNQFVRDGVASKESLIDNNEVFTNKLNNGEYAVSWFWLQPDKAKLQAAGKPYQYRKVYVNIPQDASTYLNPVSRQDLMSGGISIFKDKVKEEDVPRILQYLDFFYTDAGQKLMVWGPKSAGLFTEENGVRKYTDKDLEDCMVNGVANDADLKYNLASGNQSRWFPPAYPSVQTGFCVGGLQNPKYSSYDLTKMPRSAANADQFFSTGTFNKIKYSKLPVDIAPFFGFLNYPDAFPDMKRFWDVKASGFEPLMTKVMAASSDEQFETSYNNLVKYASDNGLNDDSMRAAEETLKSQFPDVWAAYLAGNAQ